MSWNSSSIWGGINSGIWTQSIRRLMPLSRNQYLHKAAPIYRAGGEGKMVLPRALEDCTDQAPRVRGVPWKRSLIWACDCILLRINRARPSKFSKRVIDDCILVITIITAFFMNWISISLLLAYFIRSVGIPNTLADDCLPLIMQCDSICSPFARQKADGVYLKSNGRQF